MKKKDIADSGAIIDSDDERRDATLAVDLLNTVTPSLILQEADTGSSPERPIADEESPSPPIDERPRGI